MALTGFLKTIFVGCIYAPQYEVRSKRRFFQVQCVGALSAPYVFSEDSLVRKTHPTEVNEYVRSFD